MTTQDFKPGNYRFIPAVFQYSSGAAALPGYEIEHVRFHRWLPLAEGFAAAAKSRCGTLPAPKNTSCRKDIRAAFWPLCSTPAADGLHPQASITRSNSGTCGTARSAPSTEAAPGARALQLVHRACGAPTSLGATRT